MYPSPTTQSDLFLLLKVWDLASKKVVRSYDDHAGLVNTVAFHPDGTCIASAGEHC
jgi:WD40 repeat protein